MLVNSYDRYSQAAGNLKIIKVGEDKYVEQILLPLAHTTQVAQIEVNIFDYGGFAGAKVIDKKSTVIPFTEESGSRTSTNFVSHALHDKLMYVAGDYTSYIKDEKNLVKKREAHKNYLNKLKEWCESEYSNERVKAIYQYLEKGTLIQDLVTNKVLFVDDNNKLLTTWPIKNDKERPKIFSECSDQTAAFVRFNVVGLEPYKNIWEDKEIFENYTKYYQTKLKDKGVCYVTGEILPLTDRHPSKIRNAADMAKLISSNDSDGFTYLGRFTHKGEVATISYEASQKAHNVLKWLIEKQGYAVNDRVFLVWGEKNINQPPVIDSLEYNPDTQEVFAGNFNLSLMGRAFSNADKENINLLILDSATTGRLAITNYRVLDSQSYFKRLENWGKTCCWPATFVVNSEVREKVISPSLPEIATIAYGPRPDKKIVKYTIERLLPCVLDNQRIPNDVLQRIVSRVSRPTAFSDWNKSGKYEWERALFVACALIRKMKSEGEYGLELDEKMKTRSYLFGQLLAVADVLETEVLKKKQENRLTNAMRLKHMFSMKPATTWKMIDERLEPYSKFLIADSPGLYKYYRDTLDEIMCEFDIEDFSDNKRLDPEFLLGFSKQRKALYTKKKENQEG